MFTQGTDPENTADSMRIVIYLDKFGGLLFPNETRDGNLTYAAHWKAIKKVKKSLTAQGATWAVFSCASRFS